MLSCICNQPLAIPGRILGCLCTYWYNNQVKYEIKGKFFTTFQTSHSFSFQIVFWYCAVSIFRVLIKYITQPTTCSFYYASRILGCLCTCRHNNKVNYKIKMKILNNFPYFFQWNWIITQPFTPKQSSQTGTYRSESLMSITTLL